MQTVQTLLLWCEQPTHSIELATLIRKAGWEPLITHNAVAFGYQAGVAATQSHCADGKCALGNGAAPDGRARQNEALMILLNPAGQRMPRYVVLLAGWPDGQTKLFDLLKGA